MCRGASRTGGEWAREWADDLTQQELSELGGIFVWAAAKRVDATERDTFLRLMPFRQILIYDPFHDGTAANVNANQSATIYSVALGTGSSEQITDEMVAARVGRDLASPPAQRRTVQTVSLSVDLEAHGLGNEGCVIFFVSGSHENLLRSLIAGIEFGRTFVAALILSEPTWTFSVEHHMEVRGFSRFISLNNSERRWFVKDDLSWMKHAWIDEADACDLRVTILEPCATCLVDGPSLPFRLVVRIDLLQRTPTAHSVSLSAHDGDDGSVDDGTTEVVVIVRLHGQVVADIGHAITGTSARIEAWITPSHRTVEELKMCFLVDRMLRVEALSECRGRMVFAERMTRQASSHAFFVHAALDPEHWPPSEPATSGSDTNTAEEVNWDVKPCLLLKGGSAVPVRDIVIKEDCEDYSIECVPGVQATLQLLGLPNELGSPTNLFSGALVLPASMCALIMQSRVPLHLRWKVSPTQVAPMHAAKPS